MASREERLAILEEGIEQTFGLFDGRKEEVMRGISEEVFANFLDGKMNIVQLTQQIDGVSAAESIRLDPATASPAQIERIIEFMIEGAKEGKTLSIGDGQSFQQFTGNFAALGDNWGARTYEGPDIELPDVELPDAPELPEVNWGEVGEDLQQAGLEIANLPGTLITTGIQTAIDGVNLAGTGVQAAYEGAVEIAGDIPLENSQRAIQNLGEGGIER